MISFEKASFVKTAIWPEHYPKLVDGKQQALFEIAVAGRSNAGKSSLLNHLFRRKNLVKTSSVPGKTQALNFFLVDEQLVFVDLPGYGYAKVPQKLKKLWAPMMERYLQERQCLRLLILVLDIRRNLSEEDQLFCRWASYHKVPFLVVLSKTDKVKKNEKKIRKDFIKSRLEEFGDYKVLNYSIKDNNYRKELMHNIYEIMNMPRQVQD